MVASIIPSAWGTLGGEALVIVIIAIVLYLIFRLGRSLLKVIFAIIANSILGVLAIYAVDYLFNMGIPLTLPILIPTALFGLPGVGTMIILRFFGIPL